MQSEVDAVAAFLETAEDLKREPFMSEDEFPRTTRHAGRDIVFRLGDRAHFRSALISFRRLWMQTEPCYYNSVLNIFSKYDETFRVSVQSHCKLIRDFINKTTELIPSITNEKIINLWLNTVFAHSGLKKNANPSRADFDGLVLCYGVGRCEYVFRLAVLQCSRFFVGINGMAVKVLSDWEKEFSLTPSFAISSPFGRKKKEVMSDGVVVIRQASSKYYAEEPVEKTFFRILNRYQFSSIKFFFDNLDASDSGKALLAFCFGNIEGILKKLEYKIIEDGNSENLNHLPNLKAFQSAITMLDEVEWIPEAFAFDQNFTFYASKRGVAALNFQLRALIDKLQSEE